MLLPYSAVFQVFVCVWHLNFSPVRYEDKPRGPRGGRPLYGIYIFRWLITRRPERRNERSRILEIDSLEIRINAGSQRADQKQSCEITTAHVHAAPIAAFDKTPPSSRWLGQLASSGGVHGDILLGPLNISPHLCSGGPSGSEDANSTKR